VGHSWSEPATRCLSKYAQATATYCRPHTKGYLATTANVQYTEQYAGWNQPKLWLQDASKQQLLTHSCGQANTCNLQNTDTCKQWTKHFSVHLSKATNTKNCWRQPEKVVVEQAEPGRGQNADT
jgi:hypothetical protein